MVWFSKLVYVHAIIECLEDLHFLVVLGAPLLFFFLWERCRCFTSLLPFTWDREAGYAVMMTLHLFFSLTKAFGCYYTVK